MATTTLKTRIKHKIDTASNWASSNLVPLEGELVIYKGDKPQIKVGDGSTAVGSLPFIKAGSDITVTQVVASGTKIASIEIDGVLNNLYVPSTIAWGNITGKPNTFPPSEHSHNYLPLSGGTMTGNLQIGNSNSTTTTADPVGIVVRDLREVAMTPSTLGDRNAVFYFDTIATDNAWKSILRVKGWAGDYATWELAGPAESNINLKSFYVRSGVEDTWNDWEKLLTDKNYTSYCAPASHTHSYLPLSGGTLTGNLTLSTTSTGDSPSIIFNRGSSNDTYTDWRIIDSAGALKFGVRLNTNDFTNKIIFDENGNITASSFIGNLSGIATKAEKSYLTYNDSKVYYYNFGGAQDLNWKKVASIAYAQSESYVGATIKGIVYHFTGNYNQTEVREYNFQVNNTFTGGGNAIVDTCVFRRSPGCPDIIRVVKIGTNNYELQIRQLQDWQKTAIQFTISSTNLIVPCDPVNSSNNSAISVSGLSDSHSLYSEYAYRVKDIGDNRDLTFNYSANGLSSVTWLAGWNGSELRAVSPSVITAGAATKLSTARTISLTGSVTGSGSFDGSGNLSIATTTNHTHSYLPLSGGSISGNLTFSAATSGTTPQNQRISINGVAGSNAVADAPGIGFHTGNVGWATMKCVGSSFYFYDSSCSGYVPIYGSKVYGAVWNDYAEFRSGSITEPGRVVHESPDGILRPSTSRLEPGCEIISDTFGFAIGETDECKTPIAVTGRVLAYTDTDRYSFNLGDAVCSGPNGTVSRMTREEIREYPERILGTVSEIPEYDEWGTGNIKVNGRIWIRIR